MKKVFLSFLVALTMLTGCSKDEDKVVAKNDSLYESVVVCREQNFYLNSAMHLGFNSRQRVQIPVRLPKNTVAFYYVVSVTETSTPVKNINLGVQLASLLVDQTGVLGSLASKITTPTVDRPGKVDVFLLDYDNMKAFLAEDSFSYYVVGSRHSFINGVIDVLPSEEGGFIEDSFFTRDFYIGLSNPRTVTGESVSIEVVAVVKKEK